MQQTTVIDKMRELAAARQERYMNVIVDQLPSLWELPGFAYLGTFSYTLPGEGVRFIARHAAIDIGFGIQTPAEIARDYIRVKYPGRRRARGYQAELIWKKRSQPMYAKTGNHGDCAYVDITSAYWSILNLAGWDVDYCPNRFVKWGTPPTDFPCPTHKLARNSLVSSCLLTPSQVWNGYKIEVRKHRNPALNMSLWAFVQDVLTGIAIEMLDLGAKYINTDGYIVPFKKTERAMSIIREWGLNASIKASGDTYVSGVGVYRVGEKRTKHFRPHSIGTREYVRHVEIGWLKERCKAKSINNNKK